MPAGVARAPDAPRTAAVPDLCGHRSRAPPHAAPPRQPRRECPHPGVGMALRPPPRTGVRRPEAVR